MQQVWGMFDGSNTKVHVQCCFDIHVSVHLDITYENDQQDATV